MLAVLYVVEDIGLWVKFVFKLNVPVMVFVGFFLKEINTLYIFYIFLIHMIFVITVFYCIWLSHYVDP